MSREHSPTVANRKMCLKYVFVFGETKKSKKHKGLAPVGEHKATFVKISLDHMGLRRSSLCVSMGDHEKIKPA